MINPCSFEHFILINYVYIIYYILFSATRSTLLHNPKPFKWTAKLSKIKSNSESVPTITVTLCWMHRVLKWKDFENIGLPFANVRNVQLDMDVWKNIRFSMTPGVKVKVEINLSWANITFCLGANYFVCMLIQVSASRASASAYRLDLRHITIMQKIWNCRGTDMICTSLCSITSFCYLCSYKQTN